MRKAMIFVLCGLLLGVAVTVFAQVTWRSVPVKFDDTTVHASLGGRTEYVYLWQTQRQINGQSPAPQDCDAACRRLTLGTAMLAAYKDTIAERVRSDQLANANAQADQILAALQGSPE